MTIVGGFDVHRGQITFDYLRTESGDVVRGRIAPADRPHLAAWLSQLGDEPAAFAVEGCTGCYGWSRSLMDGIDGTRTWCGWGVLAASSVKIGGLLDAKDNPPAPKTQRRSSPRPGAGKAPPRTDPPPSLPLSA